MRGMARAQKEVVKNPLKKKIKRKRKRRLELDEDGEKAATVISRLHQKFGARNTRQLSDHPACLRKNDADQYTICNSERYNAIMSRATDSVSSRIDQGFCQGEYVPTRWKCAFCQQRSSRSILGDLFGPYFVKIPDEHWPSFLAKKPSRTTKQTEHWFDLWMHGDCALSAPGIHLCGTSLPALQTKITSFWAQHCCVCSKEGATMELGGKVFHYPCAYQKGKLGPKRPDAE